MKKAELDKKTLLALIKLRGGRIWCMPNVNLHELTVSEVIRIKRNLVVLKTIEDLNHSESVVLYNIEKSKTLDRLTFTYLNMNKMISEMERFYEKGRIKQ